MMYKKIRKNYTQITTYNTYNKNNKNSRYQIVLLLYACLKISPPLKAAGYGGREPVICDSRGK